MRALAHPCNRARAPLASPARRRVLAHLGALIGAAAIAVPSATSAAPRSAWPMRSGIRGIDQRHLLVSQTGNGEILHRPFRSPDGGIDRHGMNALSWLFRDWRDGDQGVLIDIRLFDLLATIQTVLSVIESSPAQIVLNSGYRTPERNRTIEGAAANSQHIHGRAADIVIPGISHDVLRDAAEIAAAPGLGRYPGFTHVDVGPPGRRWSG